MQKFNIIMEDGEVYTKAFVITGRGFARDRYDVKCAVKYEKFITICNKYNHNKVLKTKDVYEIEEVINNVIEGDD